MEKLVNATMATVQLVSEAKKDTALARLEALVNDTRKQLVDNAQADHDVIVCLIRFLFIDWGNWIAV